MTENTQENEVKIKGDFTPDPNVCRFVVNRPVVDGEWAYVFRSAADAPGSELISAIFELEGVSLVRLSGDTLTVTKESDDSWPKLAGKMIPLVKEIISKGGPFIQAEILEAQQSSPADDEVTQIIVQIFEQQINPALASHGGFVKLHKVQGSDVYIEMGGGCQGCAASQATMKFGIERSIKEALPQIQQVIDVTDHDAGSNPYYS